MTQQRLRVAFLICLASAAVFACSTPAALFGAESPSAAVDAGSVLSRVIPLPKEAVIAKAAQLKAGDVGVACQVQGEPAVDTAVKALKRFALADGQGKFTIRMILSKDVSKELDADSLGHLRSLPNSDQAYVIRPLPKDAGLLLAANSPVGLLYAARTVEQLVNAAPNVTPTTAINIPLATITDWPDIRERGQWGGDVNRHLDEFSAWKLNVLEYNSGVSVGPDGQATVTIKSEMIADGHRLGVKIVPYILHLEQLARESGEGLRKMTEVTSKPNPSKPLPSDYSPGLCMSSQATRNLIASWFGKVAEIPGVTDMMVWLSEDRSKCYCEKCVQCKEPYELEVQAIVEAFRKVQATHPGVRLRVLLTQGSYPVNDKVLAALPADIGVTYYSGATTYDSSRKPMIYPLLERYAASGRWLGVYPQITSSWRVVFPWTGPEFIKYRATEFASKKLSNVIGYAVPLNFHHQFNVMALAEWSWNSTGRTPEQFARVYALKTGVADPDLFVRWAMIAGDAGWALAESNLMIDAIGRPEALKPLKAADRAKAMTLAQESLQLAKRSNNPDMIGESECVLACFRAAKAANAAADLSRSSLDEPGRKRLAETLDALDAAADTARTRLIEWGERVRAKSGDAALPGRLLDTAFVLLRTCDAARAKAAKLGVTDPRPERRLHKVAQWSAADFAKGQNAVVSVDISSLVPADGGRYQIGFDFIPSNHGVNIQKVSVANDGKAVAVSPDATCEVSHFEPWHEMRLDIPPRKVGERVVLKVDISMISSNIPANHRTCGGTIGLRRAGACPGSPN
ncbi:MAG: hypothetical protein ABFC96_09325 [Thermoguttaceae bacterium]